MSGSQSDVSSKPVIVGPDGLRQTWTIEFYETDEGRKPVLEWITEDLTKTKRRALGTSMRRVLQTHGPAVVRSSWGTPIDKDIFEFRLRMNGKEVINLEAEIHGCTPEEIRRRLGLNAAEDILLRVFCTARAGKVVLLLHGYDKGESPSKKRQQTEIAEARRRLKRLKEREAIAKKATRRLGKKKL